jgi:hypothetical protein
LSLHANHSGADPQAAPRAENLSGLLDRIALAGEGRRVSIRDIRATVGERSFGPLLAVTGLFAASPLGMIPGLPTTLAATMGLISAQMLVGRDSVWLPEILLNRTIGRDRLASAVIAVRPLSRRVDRALKRRMAALTRGPFSRIIALACLLLCALIPPLELLPFMATGPCLTIAAFGLAIFLADGLLALGALGLGAGSIGLILTVLL